MVNEDRWKALAESSDALQVALAEWMAAATPRTIAAVDDASQQYTTGLAGVLDRPVAQMYAVALAS